MHPLRDTSPLLGERHRAPRGASGPLSAYPSPTHPCRTALKPSGELYAAKFFMGADKWELAAEEKARYVKVAATGAFPAMLSYVPDLDGNIAAITMELCKGGTLEELSCRP